MTKKGLWRISNGVWTKKLRKKRTPNQQRLLHWTLKKKSQWKTDQQIEKPQHIGSFWNSNNRKIWNLKNFSAVCSTPSRMLSHFAIAETIKRQTLKMANASKSVCYATSALLHALIYTQGALRTAKSILQVSFAAALLLFSHVQLLRCIT